MRVWLTFSRLVQACMASSPSAQLRAKYIGPSYDTQNGGLTRGFKTTLRHRPVTVYLGQAGHTGYLFGLFDSLYVLGKINDYPIFL
jgi:hypothetical protein